MGQRGPLPKTTKRKLLEGNPGHRPLPEDEPEPRLLAQIPPAPDWLSARASRVWDLVASELHAADMLASLDLSILELFAVAYDQWRSALEGIEKEGYTYRAYDEEGNIRFAQQTPEAVLASKFAADINKWAKVLGLGPAYRVGLRIGTDTGGKPQTTDPIANELSGANAKDINPPPPRGGKATKKKAPKKAAPKKATPKRSAKKADPTSEGA